MRQRAEAYEPDLTAEYNVLLTRIESAAPCGDFEYCIEEYETRDELVEMLKADGFRVGLVAETDDEYGYYMIEWGNEK